MTTNYECVACRIEIDQKTALNVRMLGPDLIIWFNRSSKTLVISMRAWTTLVVVHISRLISFVVDNNLTALITECITKISCPPRRNSEIHLGVCYVNIGTFSKIHDSQSNTEKYSNLIEIMKALCQLASLRHLHTRHAFPNPRLYDTKKQAFVKRLAFAAPRTANLSYFQLKWMISIQK